MPQSGSVRSTQRALGRPPLTSPSCVSRLAEPAAGAGVKALCAPAKWDSDGAGEELRATVFEEGRNLGFPSGRHRLLQE